MNTTARLSTGILGLDDVLEGGLPDASIYLLSGPPGVGKTIIAQQFIYHCASPERPVLYFSTVAEPHEKIIAHVQNFLFYRREYPGRTIHYIDLGSILAEGGLPAVLQHIKSELTSHFPGFVVIDSFRALRDFAASPRDLSVFIHSLAGLLSALRCVTLLLDESPIGELMETPMAAVADGIFHVHNEVSGRSIRRWFQVIKLRASGFRAGSHLMGISQDGARIYPRLGSYVDGRDKTTAGGFCASGVALLDEVLGGGLPRGSMNLVAGRLGTGKTVLALSFIVSGARAGEPGIFLSLQERPGSLRHTGASFGWDIAALEETGQLNFMHVPPLDIEVDRLGHELLEKIRLTGAKRVVIDAVSDLDTAAIGIDDFQAFIYALSRLLHSEGVTTLVVASIHEGGLDDPGFSKIAHVADAMVHLDLSLAPDQVSRHLRVVKARANPGGALVFGMTISSDEGLVLQAEGKTVPVREPVCS